MGRWDGSLGIFQVGSEPAFAVTLVQPFVISGGDGIEMVGTLDQHTVIFSDNASQLGILRHTADDPFGAPTMAPYDSAYGVANSVTSLR